MKKILALLVFTVSMAGAYSAYACSHAECGGGNDKCCDVGGATYYCKAAFAIE